MAGYSNQDGQGKQNRTDGGVNLSELPFVCEVAVAVTSTALSYYSVFYGYGLLEKNVFKGSLADAGIGLSPKTAAVSFGVGSFVRCFLKRLRGKHDSINEVVAGCCTGLACSFQVARAPAPHALLRSCLFYGAAEFIFDELLKRKPALAFPLSLSNSVTSAHHAVLPPFTLALPSHLLEGFSTFCKSLPKPKRCQWGLPMSVGENYMLEKNVAVSTSGDVSQHADDLN